MQHHVAFLQREPLARVLSGRKTVEIRLSIRPHPARLVVVGDAIIWKAVGGEIVAVSSVTAVDWFRDLRACDVQALAELTAPLTGGDPASAYWRAKRDSRHAVLMHVAPPQPLRVLPEDTPRGVFSGWVPNFPAAHVPIY